MHRTGVALVFAALVLLVPPESSAAEPAPAAAEAAEARLRAKVAKLIRQLGDEDYRLREAAGRELLDVGDDALPALHAACRSPDPEVADRAAVLVEKLEKDTRRLEARAGWATAGWDNTAEISTEHDAEAGRRHLVVKVTGDGEHAKSTVKLSLEGVLREEAARSARLVLKARHDDGKPVPLSVAFLTDVDGETVYFEARARDVPGGEWKTLGFDLAAADFKCEGTGWEYRSKLKGRDEIKAVMVVVGARRPLGLKLTGMRFRR
ncbi:MAG: hypothetical protein ACYTGB_00425 [Planctomycetota bacterium]|jgi:hypothetical protein